MEIYILLMTARSSSFCVQKSMHSYFLLYGLSRISEVLCLQATVT